LSSLRYEGLCVKLENIDKKKGLFNRASSLWIFLATHGMWNSDIEGNEVRAVVDSCTGEVSLVLSHKNYELIRALEANPIFHMNVERFVILKEEEGAASPKGGHIRMKRGEIKSVGCLETVKVTPLAFHAITSGFHRLGFSYRIVALQQSLAREIAGAIGLGNSQIRTPVDLFSVPEDQEITGSLAAFLSWMMGWSKLNKEARDAELTTSVIEADPSLEELEEGVDMLRRICCGEKIELKVKIEEKNRKALVLTSKLNFSKITNYISKVALGRMNSYIGLQEEIKSKVEGEEFSLAVDFSEQMGPCDIYLLVSILKSADIAEKCREIWLIGTPLSYPTAMYSCFYLERLIEDLKLGIKPKFALSSEDPAVSRTIAERISSGKRKLLYIAAGPTSHVLSFYRTLLERLKEKASAIPLTPRR